jgi:hypothetical protein
MAKLVGEGHGLAVFIRQGERRGLGAGMEHATDISSGGGRMCTLTTSTRGAKVSSFEGIATMSMQPRT